MIRCGNNYCYDDDAYCCLDDYDNEQCCTTYYYQTWWFWFIWITFLLILLSCCVGCFRAFRTRRNQYVILGQPQNPVYGSVIVSSNVRTEPGVMPAPTAPVTPPSYAPYPHEKPPAYPAGYP